MEVLFGIFIVFGGILLVLFLRSLTTLFHEMGHAIPALLFTEVQPVIVYVGSYGDISKSWNFSLGRLEMFLKFNLFDWKMGMCTHSAVKTVWQQFLVIIGGPITSLIIAAIFLYTIIRGELSDNWIFVAAAFMLAATIDFATNIYPSESPVTFHDNSIGYSDGQQLRRLISRIGLPNEFFEAEAYFYKKNYDKAHRICEQIIDAGIQKKEVLRLTTQILIEKKDYSGALERFSDLQGVKKLVAEDYFTIGFLYKKLNQSETALKHLSQSIHLKYNNPKALNSRGELFFEQGKFEFAERDFNAAIHYWPTLGIAYRNLGLLFLKRKEMNLGFKNLSKAHELSPEDPFIFYGLGLFYQEKKDWAEALENFKKAEAMNIETHVVRFKIAEIENMLNQ